jgi:type II restriction enzyme
VRSRLFCPNCGSASISQYPANRPVADFFCPTCNEEYELKSQKNRFGAKIVDGAARTMRERLAASNNPNFLLLNYSLQHHAVTNLFVVPKHFFVADIIQDRKPLASTARRAGWIGCNILLSQLPQAGRIFIVKDGQVLAKEAVLAQWQRTLFLREASAEARGWIVEVMKCIELIGKREFELADIYAFEEKLSGIYPNNRHVREKIRQQLQVLRDENFLEFIGRGTYRLRGGPS